MRRSLPIFCALWLCASCDGPKLPVAPIAAEAERAVEARKAPEAERLTLIYAHDPMCGWCYGFHPTIERLHQKWSGRIDFEILSGGLATGSRAVPIAQTRGYIQEALKRVEAHSGVKFGEAFYALMEEGTYVYDSVPPARAIAVFRQMSPERALPFAVDVQRALFHDGRPLDEAATYRAILQAYPEVDAEQFIERWEDAASLKAAEEDFERAAALGVSSYPTLLIERDGQIEPIPKQLRRFDELNAHLSGLTKRPAP